MSCNCKKEIVKDEVTGESVEKVVKGNIIVTSLLFLFSVVIIPLLYPFIIVMLFKHFFIGGKGMNLDKILSKFKKINKDEEEIVDLETLNPDEYEVVGVDVIESSKNE
jgi:hypothetical protein